MDKNRSGTCGTCHGKSEPVRAWAMSDDLSAARLRKLLDKGDAYGVEDYICKHFDAIAQALEEREALAAQEGKP